jgi:hypothetical protein
MGKSAENRLNFPSSNRILDNDIATSKIPFSLPFQNSIPLGSKFIPVQLMEIDHAGIKVEHFRIDPLDSQFGKTKTIEEWRDQSAQSGMFLFANIESPGSGFDLRVVFTKANISDGFSPDRRSASGKNRGRSRQLHNPLLLFEYAMVHFSFHILGDPWRCAPIQNHFRIRSFDFPESKHLLNL